MRNDGVGQYKVSGQGELRSRCGLGSQYRVRDRADRDLPTPFLNPIRPKIQNPKSQLTAPTSSPPSALPSQTPTAVAAVP
jgi:hypothetical protein